MKGKVILVGAGIGNPGLITMRGIECLKLADVVIYDRLINFSLLNNSPQAEWVDVGKLPGYHHYPQDKINNLLIEKAMQGKIVVRLKGGDPFIFGRGGEEAIALAKQGIPFEIVPGVSSAIAAPAYSGIPVTHRGISSGVAILTGHKSNPPQANLNCFFPCSQPEINNTAKDVFPAINTLVFLMGVENLPRIVEQLLSNHISKDTPVALVEKGSSAAQKTVVSTLENILEESNQINPPAVFIVGDVVKLRQEMQWFETLPPAPLSSLRIVNTRPRNLFPEAEDILTSKLIQFGAEVINIPFCEIVPSDSNLLTQGVERLNHLLKIQKCKWLLFTSANAIHIFLNQWFQCGYDARSLAKVKIGVIGSASADALRSFGILADFCPSHADGKSFAAELPIEEGDTTFIPLAEGGMPYLRDGLQARGAIIEEWFTHLTRSIILPESRINLLLTGGVNLLLFFSPSAFKGIIDNLERHLIQKIPIACIGETTATAVRQAGLQVGMTAKVSNVDGMLAEILNWQQSKQI